MKQKRDESYRHGLKEDWINVSTIYAAVWEFKPLTLIQRIRLSSVQDVVRISVKEKAHIMKRLSVQIVEK